MRWVATASPFPQDSATLTDNAGGTPTGSASFYPYPDAADCTGTPAYSEENVALNNGTANTNNTGFSVKAANEGKYEWRVVYSGDTKHEGVEGARGKENFTADIDNG